MLELSKVYEYSGGIGKNGKNWDELSFFPRWICGVLVGWCGVCGCPDIREARVEEGYMGSN